jgi:hypothetical protein
MEVHRALYSGSRDPRVLFVVTFSWNVIGFYLDITRHSLDPKIRPMDTDMMATLQCILQKMMNDLCVFYMFPAMTIMPDCIRMTYNQWVHSVLCMKCPKRRELTPKDFVEPTTSLCAQFLIYNNVSQRQCIDIYEKHKHLNCHTHLQNAPMVIPFQMKVVDDEVVD